LLEFCEDYNQEQLILHSPSSSSSFASKAPPPTTTTTTTTTVAEMTDTQTNDDYDKLGDNNNVNNKSLPPLLCCRLCNNTIPINSYHVINPHRPCCREKMSGKITWPSADEEHQDFPLVMIHESRQDADFFHAISVCDTVHLMFIKEGGYYYKSSGTGIGVAVKRHYHLHHGTICHDGGGTRHKIPNHRPPQPEERTMK
jgi:hypothetical protein